jgi:hypothetical protein
MYMKEIEFGSVDLINLKVDELCEHCNETSGYTSMKVGKRLFS